MDDGIVVVSHSFERAERNPDRPDPRGTRYGVRECWLLYQLERRLEVLSFADGAISGRVSFVENAIIRSAVLPEFRRTLGSFLRWAG